MSLLKNRAIFKESIVFSRDPVSAFVFSLFHKNVCYEVHDAPRKSFLNSIFFKLLPRIVATNTWKQNYLITEFRVDSDKISVAHHGIDFEIFRLDIQKESAIEKLGLQKEKKYVVYTGHLFDWKGVYTLARATLFFANDVEVLMIGGVDCDISRMKDFLEREHIERVKVLGHKEHSQIPLYLAASSVLVLPTSGKYQIGARESSPLKLFEYLASGKPIVCSDLQAIRDIVNDSHVHFVEPDKPSSLGNAIMDIITNGSKKTEAAMSLVKYNSWESRAKKITDFIEQNF